MPDTLEGFRNPAPDPTQPVTTMDGTAAGQVVPQNQHGVEISETPPPAPAPAPAPVDEKVVAQQIKNKRYRDDARSAIFEKRNAMSLEERQTLEQLDPESAAILEAHAGGPRDATVSTSPLAPREPAAPVAPAPGPVAPAGTISPTPVASNERRYTLSVYGQVQEASENDVIAAGIQALQKQHAADARMQDAATYERSLTAWRDQLQAYADDLERRTRTVPTNTQPGTAGNPAPTNGGAAAVDPATVQQALEAMENLDSAKAAQLMQKAINDAVQQGRAPTPAPTPAAPSQTGGVPRLQQPAAAAWDDDQRSAANRVFNSEFAHFSDAQFSAAKAAVDEAMADPANRGQDLSTIVRSVCRTTQRFVAAGSAPAPAPAAPVNPTADELARRQVLKARIPVTPPAASMRSATSAAPEVRYPSGSEYVQQLRSRSGSNSSR